MSNRQPISINGYINDPTVVVQVVKSYILALRELFIKPRRKDNFDSNVMGHSTQLLNYLTKWKAAYVDNPQVLLSPQLIELCVRHRGYPLDRTHQEHLPDSIYDLTPLLLEYIDFFDYGYRKDIYDDLPIIDNFTAFKLINRHLHFSGLIPKVEAIEWTNIPDGETQLWCVGMPTAHGWVIYSVTSSGATPLGIARVEAYEDVSKLIPMDDEEANLVLQYLDDEGTPSSAAIPLHIQLENLLAVLTEIAQAGIYPCDNRVCQLPRIPENQFTIDLVEELVHKYTPGGTVFQKYFLSRLVATIRHEYHNYTNPSHYMPNFSHQWELSSTVEADDSTQYLLDLARGHAPERYEYLYRVKDLLTERTSNQSNITPVWITISIVYHALRALYVETIADDMRDATCSGMVGANFARSNAALRQFPSDNLAPALQMNPREYLSINHYLMAPRDIESNMLIKQALYLVTLMHGYKDLGKDYFTKERTMFYVNKLQEVLLTPLYYPSPEHDEVLYRPDTIKGSMDHKITCLKYILHELILDPEIEYLLTTFDESQTYRIEDVITVESEWTLAAGSGNITSNRAISTCVYRDLLQIKDYIPRDRYTLWLRDMKHISGMYMTLLNLMTSSDVHRGMADAYSFVSSQINRTLDYIGRLRPRDGLAPIVKGGMYSAYYVIHDALEAIDSLHEMIIPYNPIEGKVDNSKCTQLMRNTYYKLYEDLETPDYVGIKEHLHLCANTLYDLADSMHIHPFYNHNVNFKAMSEHGSLLLLLKSDKSPIHQCETEGPEAMRYFNNIYLHLLAIYIAIDSFESWSILHYNECPYYPNVPQAYKHVGENNIGLFHAFHYKSQMQDGLVYRDIRMFLPLFNAMCSPKPHTLEDIIAIHTDGLNNDGPNSPHPDIIGHARCYLPAVEFTMLSDKPVATIWSTVVNGCAEIIDAMDKQDMHGVGRYSHVNADDSLSSHKYQPIHFDRFRMFVIDTFTNCLMFILADPYKNYTPDQWNTAHKADIMRRYRAIEHMGAYMRNISGVWKTNQAIPMSPTLI